MKAVQNNLCAGASLFTSVRWPKSKQPKRADVLSMLDQLLPWREIEDLLRPHYSFDTQKKGRPGVSLSMLVRCAVLQMFWRLSDDGLEAMIHDSHSACKFIGSDPWQPRPPSASRIRNFRHWLANHLLDFELRRMVLESLEFAGLEIRPGSICEPMVRKRSGSPCANSDGRGAQDA